MNIQYSERALSKSETIRLIEVWTNALLAQASIPEERVLEDYNNLVDSINNLRETH